MSVVVRAHCIGGREVDNRDPETSADIKLR